MAGKLAEELIATLEPLAVQHGLELVTVEVAGSGPRQVVRVFLDREGGIDIEAIAAANAWIAEAIDPVSRLRGPYTLEVSSPGIERVLRKREDFERFAGRSLTVQTTKPIEGRSKFTGELGGVAGENVVIVIDGEERRVPLESIERARLKADFE